MAPLNRSQLPKCPVEDIIAHTFLPKMTPSSVQSNLLEVEKSLLIYTANSISSLIQDLNLNQLKPIETIFLRWIDLQTLSASPRNKYTESEGHSFVKTFQNCLSQLENGDDGDDTIPLYVRKQNAALLIRKKSDNLDIEVATFRCSLPSNVIMSNVSPLTMTFPETSEMIRNKELLFSELFARQLLELTTEHCNNARATIRKCEARWVPEPFLVIDWLVGNLCPTAIGQGQGQSSIKKKMRDQVNLGGGSSIPFRRSGMWMCIKVTLQLKLSQVFHEAAEATSKFLYKVILLRVLSFLCEKYQARKSLSLDLATQMVAKMARRISKLETFYNAGIPEEHKQCLNLEAIKIFELDRIHPIIEKMTKLMKNVHSKMIKEESQSVRDMGRVVRTKCEFLQDLSLKIPWLDSEVGKNLRNQQFPTITEKRKLLSNQSGVKRYPTLKSILEVSGFLASGEIRIWLHDTEEFVKTQQLQEKFPSDKILELAETYVKIAKSFYNTKNPIGTSQMFLVILKLHQELDKLTCAKFPLLKSYIPEIEMTSFEKFKNLLLPHADDLQLLDDLIDYFMERHKNAEFDETGLFSGTGEINPDSFPVRFAKDSETMTELKQKILQDMEKEIEEKYEEIRGKIEECDQLQRQINGTICQCCSCPLPDTKVWTRGKIVVRLQKKRKRLQDQLNAARKSVAVYERRLPMEENWQDVIVFELRIPQEISDWSASLAMLNYEILGETVFGTGNSKVVMNVLSYSKLNEYLECPIDPDKVIYLGSKCLPASSTISWGSENPDVYSPRENFIVENGLQCVYHYNRKSIWIDTIQNIEKLCAFRVEDAQNLGKGQQYASLQKYLETTTHTQNEVIAGQNECHDGLSLEEFIAFGSLRAGPRIQLRNLYRAISSRLLSLEEEPVLCLILQTLWQVESRSEATGQREAHLDFQEENFSLEFLDMLEEFVRENQSNYGAPFILLGAIVITTRSMELNQSESCQTRCYSILKTWRRDVIQKWVAKIHTQLGKSCSPEEEQSLNKNLLEVRLCSAFTFKAFRGHDCITMKNSDDIRHWLETVHDLDGLENISGSLTHFSKTLLDQVKNLALTLHLEEKIKLKDTSEMIHDALKRFIELQWNKAKTMQPSRFGQSGSFPSIVSFIYHSDYEDEVTFDLIQGTFLVNGFCQSKLPQEVASSKLFQRFFGGTNTKLRVQRDSLQITRTVEKFFEKHYVFTTPPNSEVTIQEIQDHTKWTLLDSEGLRGKIPNHLVDNYTHWLDFYHGTLHFRRLRPVDCDATKSEFLLQKDANSNWKLIQKASGRHLVSIESTSFADIIDIISGLEDKNYIDIFVKTQTCHVMAHLRRHNLRFVVDTERELLRSLEYPGFHVSLDQSAESRGTLIGFQNALLLDKQTFPIKRLLIVPHGDISITSGHRHQNVKIDLTTLREPTFFVYEYDSVLKRLKCPKSKPAWLYLAALHAATAAPLPDPFTGLTGTEMAMRILQTAFVWSCSPYDEESLKILEFIRSLSPKRTYFGVKPSDGKSGSMESTEWSHDIPSLAAFDGFEIIADKLVADSMRLSKLYPGHTATKNISTSSSSSSPTLRLRAYQASLSFYSEIVAIEKVSKEIEAFFNSTTKINLNSLRSTNFQQLQQIAAARLKNEVVASSKNISLNLTNFLLTSQSLSGNSSKYPEVSTDVLFSSNLRSEWLRLYSTAISIKLGPEDELKFTRILTALAYKGEPFQQILNLHHLSILSRRSYDEHSRDFPLAPSNSSDFTYDVPTNWTFNSSEVQNLLSSQAQSVQFPNNCRRYCHFTLPLTSSLQCKTNQRFETWYKNYQLKMFVEEVDAKLKTTLAGHPSPSISLTNCQSVSEIVPKVRKAPTRNKNAEEYFQLGEIIPESMMEELQQIFSSGSTSSFINCPNLRKRKLLEEKTKRIFVTIETAVRGSKVLDILKLARLAPIIDPLSILKMAATQSEKTKVFAGAMAVLWTHLKRLNRALSYSPESPELKKELDNEGHQNWSSGEHPEWLLLELELDIMIRPVQVEVARRMMKIPKNNGNGVMQLNMGEGKTSVIVPMLCATLSGATEGSLCRVTVLSAMFKMNLGILASAIGGLLNQRVYTIPCRRDMFIDDACVDAIRESYEECLQMKGVVLTLPEYRLSFRLLAYDKMLKKLSFSENLGRKLWNVENWLRAHARDVLDESDELLGVKYQLVYTVGGQVPVDGDELRWTISQKLLQIVQRIVPDLLKKHGPTKLEVDGDGNNGSRWEFGHIRLLHDKENAKGGNLEFLGDFLENVANHVLDDLFMLTNDQREAAKRFLTEKEIPREIHDMTLKIFGDAPGELKKILLISGYLRRGILPLALGKRWRVDYGVDEKGSRLMAVPFRAKDVAAEKTEFGHPDLAIVLTQLSYYYQGLSDQQLLECLEYLKRNLNAGSLYSSWINEIPADRLDPSLVNYENLNLKDLGLRKKLFQMLRRHAKVIDYWLGHRVFPKESKQFPGKLVMTSWDLCYERHRHPVCGFSGTNDSSVLLPLPITQQDLPKLLETNAKMEKILLQPENCGHRGLPVGVTCRQILEMMKQDNLTILIDAGALMLECNNEQLADLWLEVNPDLEAVVYFSKDNELLVKVKSSSSSRSTDSSFELSPYSGRLEKCGVFLDDEHTRGTDLKFPVDSRACVTIGGKMKRDKLIQACMRMRKLGCGHSVTFYLSHDVQNKIVRVMDVDESGMRMEEDVTTAAVLEWVAQNTAEFNQDGLLHWAIAAKNYAQRLAAEENFETSRNLEILANQCVDDEVISLSDMFGRFTVLELLHKVVPEWFEHSKRKLVEKNNGKALVDGVIQKFETIRDKVRAKCEELVPTKTHFITEDGGGGAGGGMEEEQEKELECELEVEVEEERQIERPGKCQPWKPKMHPNVVRLITDGGRLTEEEAGIRRLPNIFDRTTFWSEVQPEGWGGEVFTTNNFVLVIRLSMNSSHSNTDSHLRPIEYLASFRNESSGEVQLLLLSSFEVNELIPKFRGNLTKSRLLMFSTRRKERQDLLLNNPRLQLPQTPVQFLASRMEVDHEDFSVASIISEDSPSFAALFMASGSLYFRSIEEQRSFAKFLSLVPQPWSTHERTLFERGFITKSTFLLPGNRDHQMKDEPGRRSFSKDPIVLLRKILHCRHAIVTSVCHVERLLNEKCFIEIGSITAVARNSAFPNQNQVVAEEVAGRKRGASELENSEMENTATSEKRVKIENGFEK